MNHGIVVPKKYVGQVMTFCENMGISYKIWTENELMFSTVEDQKRVHEWIKRLERLEIQVKKVT